MIDLADSTGDSQALGGREWTLLVAWPWVLAGLVALSARGAAGGPSGVTAATVLASGVVFLALVAAPTFASAVLRVAESERAGRVGMLSAASGALALPGLVAVTLAAPSPRGTVLCGAAFLMVSTYALVRAAVLLGDAYPAVAAIWLGAPPFVYYLLRDVLARRADGLLVVGPASGAAWLVLGPSAWGRLLGAVVVPALAGAALTVVLGGTVPQRSGKGPRPGMTLPK